MFNVFEAGIIIAVVAIITSVIREYIAKNRTIEKIDLSGIENRLDKLESLQQRIQTLEAIVTDKGYDLRQEINNLK